MSLTFNTIDNDRMTNELTVSLPDGRYFLGDPCYAFNNDDNDSWMNLLDTKLPENAADNSDYLVAGVTEDGMYSVSFNTAYGDGVYPLHNAKGDFINDLGVDAGLIGLTDVRIAEKTGTSEDELNRLGTIVTIENSSLGTNEDSDIFIVDGNGDKIYNIATSFEEEEGGAFIDDEVDNDYDGGSFLAEE